MSMRLSYLVVLVSLFFSLSSTFSNAHEELYLGKCTPIPNLNDTHVVEIAEYAVTEYNKQSGENLSLVKILSGKVQLVGPVEGINYRLLLKAELRSGYAYDRFYFDYRAIVFEKPWESFLNLTSFELDLLQR